MPFGKRKPNTSLPWQFMPSRSVETAYASEEPTEREFVEPLFLPDKDSGSEQLNRFLSIFEDKHQELETFARDLNKLLWYDRCPAKYIFRVAQNLGFPLLDSPYASESERRNFLKWTTWIWLRKGSAQALIKLINILCYSLAFSESMAEDFILNYHKTYDLESRFLESDLHQFNGSADGWAKEASGSSWTLSSNRYVGVGDGTDDRDNCSLVDNDYQNFYVETDFQILGGSGTYYPYFGIMLAYTSRGYNLGVFIYSDGGNDYLRISGWYMGFELIPTGYRLHDITGMVDYKSGVHRLKVHLNKEKFSVAIDDTTLITPFTFEGINTAFHFERKGLFSNESTEVAFDNFKVGKLRPMGVPRLLGDGAEKSIRLRLIGSPDNDTAKRAYLADVVPRYFVPYGVDVEWIT